MPFGKKHFRTFRIVVTESRSKLTGNPADTIGHFTPKSDPVIDSERLKYWLSKGVQPTATVRKLLGL